MTEQKVQLTNQWQTLQMVEVKKEVKKLIQGLEKKIAALHEKMHALSQKQGSLSEPIQRLMEIKGIGEQSAHRIMAYLPDLDQFHSAKQLAAYVGVSPRQYESGKYQGKTRLSKMGNSKFRKALYMPALSAKCFNEHLRPFVKRLEAKGLKPKAIIGALMRKLVHIIYGMLKHKQPFNPALV